MGVKKSTVCTSASLGERRYTPASSALSKPTSTFGSSCRANFPSTASSAAGLSLLAQPAALTCSVSRIGLASAIRSSVNRKRGKTNQPWISELIISVDPRLFLFFISRACLDPDRRSFKAERLAYLVFQEALV